MNLSEIKNDTLVLVAAYGLLFGWAVVHTVYQDHEDLVTLAGKATNRLEAITSPQLKASIDVLMVAPYNGKTMVTMQATITNTGSPSIAQHFDIFAHFPNGTTEKGQFFPLPPEGGFYTLRTDGKDPPRRVYEDAFLEKKSLDHPIAEGGAASGIIMRTFHAKKIDFLPGTIIELKFIDVNNKPYSVTSLTTIWRNSYEN